MGDLNIVHCNHSCERKNDNNNNVEHLPIYLASHTHIHTYIHINSNIAQWKYASTIQWMMIHWPRSMCGLSFLNLYIALAAIAVLALYVSLLKIYGYLLSFEIKYCSTIKNNDNYQTQSSMKVRRSSIRSMKERTVNSVEFNLKQEKEIFKHYNTHTWAKENNNCSKWKMVIK